MKVLFLVDNPYKALNPYTSTLIDGLKSIDCEIYIDWGILKLWEEKVFDFDIVHIMWPHLLLCRGKFSVKELFCRIDEIKKRQVKIVSTCHNIVPHYCDETNAVAAYNIVYSLSDIVLHLGNYSLHLFEKTYPNVKHLLLYHHIYDDRYKKTITKKTAIKKLHLDKNKRYILCFGAFRDREEQILIQNILNNINDDKIRIIAPQYCGIGKRSNILYILKFLYYKFKFPKIKMHFGAINDIDLPIYFALPVGFATPCTEHELLPALHRRIFPILPDLSDYFGEIFRVFSILETPPASNVILCKASCTPSCRFSFSCASVPEAEPFT